MTQQASPRPASVIVVSRHRAAALTRCLTALSQQDHPNFEVIVVADPAGVAAVQAQGLAVKLVAFDEPNISAARNAGLTHAAAGIVAFLDDDSVAEPTWLSRLCAGFSAAGVVAATGYVRGRNGISYQWRACEVDIHGQDHAVVVPTAGISLRAGTPRRAVKTQGTNCAFLREALAAAGGFDEAFRFYLDEADVNLRMAGLTAIVPQAQVHHGYLASGQRRDDRVPTDLHDIAASTAVFLRRHAAGPGLAVSLSDGLARLRKQQRTRLEAHVASRRISRTEADRLMQTLEAGWTEGAARAMTRLPPLAKPASPFQPLPGTGPRPGCLIAGRIWQRRRLIRQATAEVAKGTVPTVICLSPGPRAHRMTYHDAGFWLHEGGLFGWSDRTGPRLRLTGFATRVTEEAARWATLRSLGPDWVARRP